MKRLSTLFLALIVPVFLAGCTDEALTPELVEGPAADHAFGDYVVEDYATPRVLRGGAQARRLNEGEFASPLFGLATAPNGAILVADAGAGVANRFGGLEIALPGVSDIAPIGRSSMWASIGLSGDPETDTGQGLYRVSNGQARLIVDLYDFEAAENPDGKAVDSNPFDVAAIDGRAALVADAGGNVLLRVDNRGRVEVVAIFPDEIVSTANAKALFGCPAGPPFVCGLPPQIPAQAVPTSIAIGPDGYYYVGELKGFPAPVNESNVWRVSPDASGAMCGEPGSGCEKVIDGGFTSIIDLAFDADGVLHIAELDERSWFAVEFGAGVGGSITACDLMPTSCSEVAAGIPILTAITFGNDGALWATENALIPGAADVMEVIP